jgi:hypothetical protein
MHHAVAHMKPAQGGPWHLATVVEVDNERGIFRIRLGSGRIVDVLGSSSLAVGERVWIRESKEPGHGPIDVERAVYDPVAS